MEAPAQKSYRVGEALELPRGVTIKEIDDPQGCLVDGKIAAAGFHTVFANVRVGDCSWAMPISFTAKAGRAEFVAVPALRDALKDADANVRWSVAGAGCSIISSARIWKGIGR